jgi:hypothetical protein
MPLNIPKRDSVGIASIIQLPASSVDDLIKAMVNAPGLAEPSDMAKYISDEVLSIPSDKLDIIINTLYNIYRVREFADVNLSSFLDDLVDGISTSNYPELSIKDIEPYIIRSRFENLLDIENLKIISKAFRLQSDAERLYCSSKILSDLRPVFSEDPKIRPSGAVITHTLKIVHHLGKELEEFRVILDSHELELLKEVIIRAYEKDKTLRALMKEVDLKDLGV